MFGVMIVGVGFAGIAEFVGLLQSEMLVVLEYFEMKAVVVVVPALDAEEFEVREIGAAAVVESKVGCQ